jgi:hypothetical protein
LQENLRRFSKHFKERNNRVPKGDQAAVRGFTIQSGMLHSTLFLAGQSAIRDQARSAVAGSSECPETRRMRDHWPLRRELASGAITGCQLLNLSATVDA